MSITIQSSRSLIKNTCKYGAESISQKIGSSSKALPLSLFSSHVYRDCSITRSRSLNPLFACHLKSPLAKPLSLVKDQDTHSSWDGSEGHSRTNERSSYYGYGILSLAFPWFNSLPVSSESDKEVKGTPLDQSYWETLPKRELLENALKNREGVLNLKGLSKDDVINLAEWLTKNHHSFMRLKEDKLMAEKVPRAYAAIKKELQSNKERFRDRASPFECATFAVLSYDNKIDPEKLPKGWEIFKIGGKEATHSDDNNGYNGVAFVKHETGQVIIAHRGTEFIDGLSFESVKNFLKDLCADFKEVASQKIGPQQESAVKFSREVHDAIRPYNYKIGCVGHSLGGWLAQLTACDLKREKKYEAYAVCLDSPGAVEMLDTFYKKRYGTEIVEEVDVVNYMQFPNFVNTSGIHSGTLYQVINQIELKALKEKDAFSYLLKTHSKDTILKAFKEADLQEPQDLLLVQDWPHIPWKNVINPSDLSPVGVTGYIYSLIKSPVETVLKTYKAKKIFDEESIEYKTFFQLDSSESIDCDSFYARYKARYQTGPHRKDQGILLNTFEGVKKLFEHLSLMKGQGDPQALHMFLEQTCKISGIPRDDLMPLLDIEIKGNSFFVKGTQDKSALDLRRIAERTLKCFPNLPEKLQFSNYLNFALKTYPRLKSGEDIFLSLPSYPDIAPESIDRKDAVEDLIKEFEKEALINLYGKDGSGKLELVKQFCRAFEKRASTKKQKNAVDIFDASDLETLERDWVQFAVSRLGVSYDVRKTASENNVIEEAYNSLETFDTSLIVFNKVSNLEVIQEYFSQKLSSKIKVLIISSSDLYPEVGKSINIHERFPLKKEEIKKLLLPVKDSSREAKVDKILNENKLAIALGKSPYSVKLLKRQLEKDSSFDVPKFINEIRMSNEELDQIMTKNVINKVFEKDVAMDSLFKSIPLMYSQKISRKVMTDWMLSPEAHFQSSEDLDKKRVDDLVETLIEYGVVEEVNGAESLSVSPCMYQAIKSKVDGSGDTSSEIALKPIVWDFLRFLEPRITLNNVYYEDFKNNKDLFGHLMQLSKEGKNLISKMDKKPLILTSFNNAKANHYLQSELYIQSLNTFTDAKKTCEEVGKFTLDIRSLSREKVEKLGLKVNPDENEARTILEALGAKDVISTLGKIDLKLPFEYARSIHYLGKIYFQIGDMDLSKSHFLIANALKTCLKADKKTYETPEKDYDIDNVIFKRQGIGWILKESNSVKDWKEAKKLYLESFEKEMHPFNHAYCNLQISRIYSQLAQEESQREVRMHYFTKALERLRDGGRRKGLSFRGSLSIAQEQIKLKRGFKDTETEVLLEIGKVLRNPMNPSHDFQKAEAIFLSVLEREDEAQGKGDNHRLKFGTSFLAYYNLSMLYKDQIKEHHHLISIRLLENEELIAKSKGYAKKALNQFEACPYETMIVQAKSKEKEIKELQNLLNN